MSMSEYGVEILNDRRFIVVSAPHGMMPPLACARCGRHMFQGGTYAGMRVLTCENACDQYDERGNWLMAKEVPAQGSLSKEELIDLLWYCFHAKDREINHLKQELSRRK